MQLALGVEYDGGAFSGYQFQAHSPSVQEALQQALSRIANEQVTVQAAGRTDAGVHATGQVVSFRTHASRPLHGWHAGVNSLTPRTISVHWVREVHADFNARFNATARRYMYLFYEDSVRSAHIDRFAVQSPPLDDAAMYGASRALLGEHNFTTFRGAGCQSRTPMRRVDRIVVHRAQQLVIIDITANAFLLHMVRNIAGALWQVGRGERASGWIGGILQGRDRSLAGPTAPARGLYLLSVSYPGLDFPDPPLPGLLRALGGLDRFC